MEIHTQIQVPKPVPLHIFGHGPSESVHRRQSGGIDSRTLPRTTSSQKRRFHVSLNDASYGGIDQEDTRLCAGLKWGS